MTAPGTAKVQRTPNGMLLGACIALSADDIAFCDSSTKRLELQKKHVEDGIIIEIRRVVP